MEKNISDLTGRLDIFAGDEESDPDDEKVKWRQILVHGDPEGLRSLARILIKLADTNQDEVHDLPVGARVHVHLRPGFELANSSELVIVGRLDAKGTGVFYDRYVERKQH